MSFIFFYKFFFIQLVHRVGEVTTVDINFILKSIGTMLIQYKIHNGYGYKIFKVHVWCNIVEGVSARVSKSG